MARHPAKAAPAIALGVPQREGGYCILVGQDFASEHLRSAPSYKGVAVSRSESLMQDSGRLEVAEYSLDKKLGWRGDRTKDTAPEGQSEGVALVRQPKWPIPFVDSPWVAIPHNKN